MEDYSLCNIKEQMIYWMCPTCNTINYNTLENLEQCFQYCQDCKTKYEIDIVVNVKEFI
jgi:hypothetical protein